MARATWALGGLLIGTIFGCGGDGGAADGGQRDGPGVISENTASLCSCRVDVAGLPGSPALLDGTEEDAAPCKRAERIGAAVAQTIASVWQAASSSPSRYRWG